MRTAEPPPPSTHLRRPHPYAHSVVRYGCVYSHSNRLVSGIPTTCFRRVILECSPAIKAVLTLLPPTAVYFLRRYLCVLSDRFCGMCQRVYDRLARLRLWCELDNLPAANRVTSRCDRSNVLIRFFYSSATTLRCQWTVCGWMVVRSLVGTTHLPHRIPLPRFACAQNAWPRRFVTFCTRQRAAVAALAERLLRVYAHAFACHHHHPPPPHRTPHTLLPTARHLPAAFASYNACHCRTTCSGADR